MPPRRTPRLLLYTTLFAYLLIGIEIVIMITPFALYFYSVYGPLLNAISSWRPTGWTTEFFLPHMVFPDDPLITAISYLQVLLPAGLLLFLAAAIPLYYGRFTGKGVVRSAFYSFIRHPQYLFLALSGFGLLLYWPRFIILIMFVTMLFVYYLLARNEEWRMKQEHQDYEAYRRRTPMFLPGEPGGRLYRLLFGWIKPKGLGLFVAYLATLTIAIMLAMGLRAYTVARLPTANVGETTLVSVFPRAEIEMRDLYRLALTDPQVRAQLDKEEGINLVYLMPGDFFLTALVTEEKRRFSEEMIERFPEILEWHQHRFRGGLGRFFRIFYNFLRTWSARETDYSVDRLIFVRVTDAEGRQVPPAHIFAMGLRRSPALIVDLDGFGEKVLAVLQTSRRNQWGDIPMPTF